MKKLIISTILIVSCFMVLFSCGSTDEGVSEIETTTVTTIEITTTGSTTKTTTTQTTTITTTSSETNTTVTTTEPVTEPVIEEYVEEVVEEYVEPVYTGEPVNYNNSDVELLAMLINAEASATYNGKLCVASCVVNRANAYGQTISQVIYAPGQFTTCYSLGYYNSDDYNAAVEVLNNGSVDTRIMYFDGCHPDCLNWFYDSYHNYLYAA